MHATRACKCFACARGTYAHSCWEFGRASSSKSKQLAREPSRLDVMQRVSKCLKRSQCKGNWNTSRRWLSKAESQRVVGMHASLWLGARLDHAQVLTGGPIAPAAASSWVVGSSSGRLFSARTGFRCLGVAIVGSSGPFLSTVISDDDLERLCLKPVC